jgi:acyl-CoA synthetase (AMP-forming)/AMP-acid ligase II
MTQATNHRPQSHNQGHLTVTDLLRAQAARHGERLLYGYLDDGDVSSRAVTYAELDRDARAIAVQLLQRCQPRERAVILAIDGVQFIRAFMACQLAGVIAVPVYTPLLSHGDRLVQTLRTVIRDCGAQIILSDAPPAYQERLRAIAPDLDGMGWVTIDAGDPKLGDSFVPVQIAPGDISFLQYTSGSTGMPKGVVVPHEALLNNLALINQAMGFTEEDVVVGWQPLFHDMGLIGNVLSPLYSGCQAYLMSPLMFVQRPERWLRAISTYRGTVSGGPNFGYELCVRRLRDEALAELDLSSWRVAFNGAEPVRQSTLAAFSAKFAHAGFDERACYPCYGLAESTLMVTGGRRGHGARCLPVDETELAAGRVVGGGDHTLVSAGTAWRHRRLAIVHPETCERLAEGSVGEIWVSGPDVAAGYWAKPELSASTFEARIAGSGEGPFLRTGDVGAVHQAELYVTGRLKDLIIVGGRNLYPSDIEATVDESHPAVRRGCCAAFQVERGGRAELVVAVEIRRDTVGAFELEALTRQVRQAIARQHMVTVDEVVVLRPHQVPKTSSGKLQRSATRLAHERGELVAVDVAPELDEEAA